MNKNKILQIRLEHNLTQKEMADKINIKQSTLSQIENNKLKPSLRILDSISKEFDVTIDWLMELSENPSLNPSLITNNISNKSFGLNFENINNYWLTNEGKQVAISSKLFEIEEAMKVFEAFANANNYKHNKARYNRAHKDLKFDKLIEKYENTFFDELSEKFLNDLNNSTIILLNAINQDIAYMVKHYLRVNNLLSENY